MKKVYIIVVLFISAMFIYGCATTPKTFHDYNPRADFATYKTFAWVSENPMVAGPDTMNPLDKQRIERAILKQLNAKGYQFTRERKNANFVVSYVIGIRNEIDIKTYPDYYYSTMDSWFWGSPYYMGRNFGETTHVSQYTQGTLSIDIFDLALNEPAWHGSIEGRIREVPTEKREQQINNSVAAILSKFPK